MNNTIKNVSIERILEFARAWESTSYRFAADVYQVPGAAIVAAERADLLYRTASVCTAEDRRRGVISASYVYLPEVWGKYAHASVGKGKVVHLVNSSGYPICGSGANTVGSRRHSRASGFNFTTAPVTCSKCQRYAKSR